ncbi:MAG: hypothetical protein A2275_17860 [Bacteroidetes bacterium RIFOXYA12_FULL_35_11]|nr:MAG: hypothetical protein A2X01_08265 [Bacteroidetes bacterium GWF2_35_48]OFY76089.1 MAG: hypothetical protein A2275_17860 [Bacteroidetes bacterium RIFOXYA12_FULL_35_11]OFY94865.1 MAG: hypothetical protein A2309_12825 [Bacteroidetes bacterium RIFOXYB2_FULL_35_7]OFY95596.1 MAG: hypothetical protein A2491_16065 [Bacteroidetes bacterium RIFOXYC12_FULL_35_7]
MISEIKNKNERKLKKIENEEWKPIPRTNGKYHISSIGRLKSFIIDKKNGQIVQGSLTSGYRRVSLKINKQTERFFIHQLVAEAFIPKPSAEHTHIIHIDSNKKNNQVSNLAWVTKEELNKRMYQHFVKYRKNYKGVIISNSNLKEEDVKLLKTMINKGIPQYKIAKMFCVSATQIKRITRGENWSHVEPKIVIKK